MAPDQTTCRRPKHAMVPGVVPDRSSYKGALDTPLRLSECWREKQQRRDETEPHDLTHKTSPELLVYKQQQRLDFVPKHKGQHPSANPLRESRRRRPRA